MFHLLFADFQNVFLLEHWRSLCFLYHPNDLMGFESLSNIQRRLPVLIPDLCVGVLLQQSRHQVLVSPQTQIMQCSVSFIIYSVDVYSALQKHLKEQRLVPLLLQQEEESEQQDGHQNTDDQKVHERQVPAAQVMKTCPLLLVLEGGVSSSRQQEVSNLDVDMATAGNEGRVPEIRVLYID